MDGGFGLFLPERPPNRSLALLKKRARRSSTSLLVVFLNRPIVEAGKKRNTIFRHMYLAITRRNQL